MAMGFWTAVVVIVACGCLLEGYRSYAKSKGGGKRVKELEARVAALESEDSIEERVRALEAIVTDPKRTLDEEISNL